MSDLIDRQEVLKEIKDMYNAAHWWSKATAETLIKTKAESYKTCLSEMALRVYKIPSAQPEIIRCKDCYLRYTSCPMVVRNGNCLTFFTKDEDFCSYAKGEEE